MSFDFNPPLNMIMIPADQQVSQAAACDGTLITTSAASQEIMPGTLPTF